MRKLTMLPFETCPMSKELAKNPEAKRKSNIVKKLRSSVNRIRGKKHKQIHTKEILCNMVAVTRRASIYPWPDSLKSMTG